MSGSQVYVKAINHSYSMQSGPKQKGHIPPVNSRTNVVKSSVIPAKRRAVKVEEPVNKLSLEDRIRALTIFEDEEVGKPLNVHRTNSSKILDNGKIDAEKITVPTHDLGSTEMGFRNINFENGSDYVSGYYTALPVDIVAKDSRVLSNSPEKELYYPQSKLDARNGCDHVQTYEDEVFSPQFEENGQTWKDYTQFLEKASIVSTQNLDTAVQQEMSGFAASSVIHQQGSPVASRTQMHDFSNSNARALSAHVTNEFGHFQNDKKGQGTSSSGSLPEPREVHSSQGSYKGSIDDNARVHSSNGMYLLRSMQDFQEEHPSHIGGQTSGSIFQTEGFIQQEYPFSGHMRQQEPENSWPSQPRSHDKAYSSNSQHLLSNGVTMTPGNMAPASRGRASWQPWSSFEQQQFEQSKQANRMELNNSFVNEINIPNIHTQIRATSEQCLQESSKHIFASSADINKLFSGQKKPATSPQIPLSGHFQSGPQTPLSGHFQSGPQNPLSGHFQSSPQTPLSGHFQSSPQTPLSGHFQSGPQTPLSGHFQSGPRDHPFNCSIQSHLTDTSWPESSQAAQESSKPKLRVLMHPVPTTSESSTTPITTDHNVYIPSNAWTNVVSLPSSVQSEGSRSSLHSHNNCLSPYSDQYISAQRSSLAGVDIAMDRSQLPSLTSGYSSESELQQIEFNAEAIKKLSKYKKADNFRNTPVHEFDSLDRSTDSSADTDNFGGYEHVYENPSMLINPLACGPMNQPINYIWSPNTTPLGQQPFPTPDSGYSEAPYFTQNSKSQPQTNSSQGSLFTSSFNHIPDINPSSNNIMTYNNSNGHRDHMKPTISFQNKPVVKGNHVTSMANQIPDFDNTIKLKKEISPTNLLTHYSSQHISSFNDHVEYSSMGYHSPVLYPNMGHYIPDIPEPHLENSFSDYPHEPNSYNYPQLSPVEIVRMLDVPFETTIICGEGGDRLSTLV